MKSDKYAAYCREHRDEFRHELSIDASRGIRYLPGRTAAVLLAISSLLTYNSLADNHPYASYTLYAYAVPIVSIFAYPWVSLIFSKIDKHSRTVLDFLLLSTLLGFCLTLYFIFIPEQDYIEKSDIYIALSGQINFAILMTTAFSYHTTFKTTLARNTLFTAITAILIYLIDAQFLVNNAIQVVQGYLGGIMVSWLFFSRIQTRFYYKSTDADTRQHLYKQLSKLVYPHQLARIKAGDQLEETMPIARSDAIVNVFDIRGSSTIKHQRTQSFFLEVFRAFSQICMMGYQHNPLRSRAFRLKETGDGFISAVGYPFMTENQHQLADHALETALLMFRAFNREVEKFGYGQPIKAAMGLAYNAVQGTFQSSGIRSYDLFGDALVQAYRYEEMRKNPVIAEIMRVHALSIGLAHYNMLMIQEVIYNSLSKPNQQLFTAIDLKAIDYPMPQDPDAQFLYFYLLE
jgi:class 3 adenylate cyclase